MGESEEISYADVRYSIKRKDSLTTKEQNDIIETVLSNFWKTGKEFELHFSVQRQYVIISCNGNIERKIVSANISDKNALVQTYISQANEGIFLKTVAKPKLKEEAYAALEKVLYEHSTRYQ